jgi:RHH-type transcriptional regulator, proline utilization regulon repressor / proline dehydrogenase / delta 1-pyrroline-5-carboxylate dehydrogenase
LQALFGMAEPIKAAFRDRGFLVREYAPVGELLPGMAYLVRRLLENTSNKGFIRQGFHEGETAGNLLARPEPSEAEADGEAYLEHDPRAEFHNAPWRDFTRDDERARLSEALRELLGRPGEDYGRIYPRVAGEKVNTCADYLRSDAPEDPGFIVAAVGTASPETVERALAGLAEAFPAWRDTPVAERAEVLFRAADILERRRTELTALVIVETGKPWIEADADVAEAIDFCRYYAHEARVRLGPQTTFALPGEDNRLLYEGRGVCAVIGPWNFPSAIPCGMFAAALVAGNTVALKPAEQSPVTAHGVFEAFLEAGMPAGVAAFLPGPGESVGRALVESPWVSTIVFTGSKAVGLGILRAAAELREGQEHLKRVIAELGGKNAIVVDEDADLDQAVQGVVASAFGYAGQKCSACSRVYVVGSLQGRFLERLKEAVASLPVGPASDPATLVGPVIDDEAVSRLRAAIAGREVLATVPLPRLGRGRYVAPVVIEVTDPDHPLLRDELFGPVLALMRVPDFERALALANRSPYGLTGAVFSRSPANLERAARAFRVGNLYLNRGSTGALVGRQPFGGARHSGVGSKAGGPDYLIQFVLPRVVTENTLRQGFAPMDDA